jgi:enoyl-CoA hydratase/carnithine racemase
MSAVLKIEDHGRVRLLTLNRADALNSFNDALYDAVTDALNTAATDDNVAVVVLTGAGRGFSAGQDLTEMGNKPVHTDGKRHGFEPFIDAVVSFPKPLISAVNGIGVGIGLTLLPHCDLVLIADTARLRAPFVSLGVTLEAGNSFLLPSRIGWAEAAHLLYTTNWIDAKKSVEIGLAWKMVPAAELLDEALQLASEIAVMSIAALVATKKNLLATRNDSVRAARDREIEEFDKLRGGPANLEAIAAFKEKRVPDFSKLGS